MKSRDDCDRRHGRGEGSHGHAESPNQAVLIDPNLHIKQQNQGVAAGVTVTYSRTSPGLGQTKCTTQHPWSSSFSGNTAR